MSTTPPPGSYVIDLSHTHAGFAVKHFGLSKVRGEFTQVEGTVVIADDPDVVVGHRHHLDPSFESRDASARRARPQLRLPRRRAVPGHHVPLHQRQGRTVTTGWSAAT